MSSNYVVVNDGVDYGSVQGQLAPFVQGEVGKVITIDVQDLAGIDFDITGATINSTATHNTGTGDVTAVSGAVAVAGGGLTWTLSAADCGTAGRYTLIVKFTLSAKVYKTFPVLFDILEDPTVTASQNPGVTGVSELEAAWLTAEKAAIEAADDGEILQSDGTNSEGTNYLTATSLRKHNYTATAAPGVGDDTADGYAPGSEWIDVTNDKAYVCLDASAGAAVWTETTAAGGGASALDDLTDVVITTPADNELLAYDTTSGDWINQTAAEAGLAAASHAHATGDVTSGTFADGRIAESNVTQHEAALSITESQISDLGAYLDAADIGVSVQAYSAKTAAIAALTWAANSIILLTGTGTAAVQALAAHVVTFLQSASAADARTAIGAAPLRPVDRDIAGTSHTFELTDESKSVRSQSGSATVFTVPLNSAVAFPTGTIIGVAQKGAGELSIAATGGVTINSLSGNLTLAGQHAEAALRKTDTNVWDLVGALIA